MSPAEITALVWAALAIVILIVIQARYARLESRKDNPMPAKIDGKPLTEHEHEIWKSAYERAKKDPNVSNPGAVATAAVKRHRRA